MITRPPRRADACRRAMPPTRPRIHGRTSIAWLWLLLVVIAAGGGAYYFIRSGGKTSMFQPFQGRPSGRRFGFNRSRPMPVTVATARRSDVPVYLNGLGTVTPLATITVRTRVDGELMKVYFREGQFVRAGAVLAEIDPRPYRVQLKQAEGQMARDQALLANARIDLQRYRVLLAQDSIASQQLDTQRALVQQYEGTVKVDRAAIDNARLQLSYCRITAPISGRLGLRLVDQGNIVHASDANGLVVITKLQPMGVIFSIPEDNLPPVLRELRAGKKLPVDVYDRSDTVKLASGVLVTADNEIDTATGTIKLKARFANADNALFPNQFVNARLLLKVLRGATVVPAAAIQRGTPGTFVYVVRPDKTVTVRVVKPGPGLGTEVSIESGLAPGDQVVVDGADRLREGARVVPIDKSAQQRATGRRPHAQESGPGAQRRRQRKRADGAPGAADPGSPPSRAARPATR